MSDTTDKNKCPSIAKLKAEMKEELDNLGKAISQFNREAYALQERLVKIVKNVFDDEDLKISVSFEFWENFLNPEVLEFKIEIVDSFVDNPDNSSPYIHYASLTNLTKILNLEDFKITSQNNHIVLFIYCRRLASSLGCDMSIWDGE